jgi:hypothetical protein
MWELYIQPIHRIDLDAINKQIPMHVGTGYTTGGTDFTDQLTGLHLITNRDITHCLMVKTAIDSITMVNDSDITANNLKAGIYDHASRGGIDIEWV